MTISQIRAAEVPDAPGYFYFTVNVVGREFRCKYWPGPCNEDRIHADTPALKGDVWISCLEPRAQGDCEPLNIRFDLRDWSASDHSASANSPFEVRSQASPLFQLLADSARHSFWRVLPEISKAIVDGLRAALLADSRPWPSRLVAVLAKERSDALGQEAVAAALRAHAAAAESFAFDSDDTAGAFAATAARLALESPRGAAPTREQLLTAYAPLPPVAAEYQCLECGYRTTDPTEISAGGMGCVRCD